MAKHIISELLYFVLEILYRANLPFYLQGPHGIGKSEIVKSFAKRIGVGFVCVDLTLLEPVDLVGLPREVSGRTVYSPPAWLPKEGVGLIFFDELNRAHRSVRAPTLQLLTTRKLHGYILPPDWRICAAGNPPDSDDQDGGQPAYQVDELDPALLSRFAVLNVAADRKAWLEWAKKAAVHQRILEFVSLRSDALSITDPRRWVQASQVLHAIDEMNVGKEMKANEEAVYLALEGILGANTREFLSGKAGPQEEAPPELILGDFKEVHPIFKKWSKQGRVDCFEQTMNELLLFISEHHPSGLKRSQHKRNVGLLLDMLPADLADDYRKELGFDAA